MKLLRALIVLGLLLLPGVGAPAAGQTAPGRWIPLFGEEPFAGFRPIGEDRIEDHWEVTPEGWIHLAKPAGYRGTILTRHRYRDFELSFFWKLEANANNGIKYRVAKLGDNWLGLEYQLLDDSLREGATRPEHRTAAIYDILPPAEDRYLSPLGQWNHSRIVVRGQHLEHWLNGQPVVVAEAATGEWRQAVAESKFKPHAKFGERRRGRILFTDHGNEVWFRDVMIRELGKPTRK